MLFCTVCRGNIVVTITNTYLLTGGTSCQLAQEPGLRDSVNTLDVLFLQSVILREEAPEPYFSEGGTHQEAYYLLYVLYIRKSRSRHQYLILTCGKKFANTASGRLYSPFYLSFS